MLAKAMRVVGASMCAWALHAAVAAPPINPPPAAGPGAPVTSAPVTSAPANATQPGVRSLSTAATQSRVADLLALIEGPNALQVRRTGVRELLLLGLPDAPARLIALLRSSNAAARVAIATALSELPQFLTSEYVEPLTALLGDADAGVRQSAAQALATAGPGAGALGAVRALSADSQQPPVARQGAITALGLMTERGAVDALATLLSDFNPAITAAALDAFEAATATEFNGSAEAALAWWVAQRDAPNELWQARQIERLINKERETARQLQSIEARFTKVLRENFQRATETERQTLLQAYLVDTAATVRLLGLELVATAMQEGRPPTPEIAAQVRAQLTAAEPPVQVAAIRTVAALREPADAERLTEMLAATRAREVRLALVNAIGFVGGGAQCATLMPLLSAEDAGVRLEVLAALGRIAERDALDAAQRDALTAALLVPATPRALGDTALRERLVRTLGALRHESALPLLRGALAGSEPSTVRSAAVRALARFPEALTLETLLTALSDGDLDVRRAALEALATQGETEPQLSGLWARLDPSVEPDDAARALAWRGVMRILAKRDAAEVARRVERLPAGIPEAQRLPLVVELLRLIESNLATDGTARDRVARVREQLAEAHRLLGRPGEALTLYLQALADRAAVATNAPGANGTNGGAAAPALPTAGAVEMIRMAVVAGLYDERLPAALVAAQAPLDCDALWRALRGDLEASVAPSSPGPETVAMLENLSKQRPCEWPAEAERELAELLKRARAAHPEPTSAPASPGRASLPARE